MFHVKHDGVSLLVIPMLMSLVMFALVTLRSGLNPKGWNTTGAAVIYLLVFVGCALLIIHKRG